MCSYIYRVASGEFHFATTGSENWGYLQSRTKYLEQNTEFRNIGLEKKKFDTHFCVISDCFCQGRISSRETRH